MHYCGIIIKEKELSVEKAREIFGEKLVEKQVCDWYSTDNYRERKFGDKQVISLQEFKNMWNNTWKNEITNDIEEFNLELHYCINLNSICKIQNEYIDSIYLENSFYEYYEYHECDKIREELIKLYAKAYAISVSKMLDETDEDKYDVCLLDYHN